MNYKKLVTLTSDSWRTATNVLELKFDTSKNGLISCIKLTFLTLVILVLSKVLLNMLIFVCFVLLIIFIIGCLFYLYKLNIASKNILF